MSDEMLEQIMLYGLGLFLIIINWIIP